MKRTCHTKGFASPQFSNGTDFSLPGSTADRYTYAYSYDNFGRLTSSERFEGTSDSATNAFSEKNLSFDRNGNILTLTRYGNGTADIKDNFTYSYDGNRLKKLDGTYNGAAITHTTLSGGNTTQTPGTADYIYDGNGNMTLDALRNITLTYDINNLVSTVSRNDTLLSTYFYLADGTKYKVVDRENKGRVYIWPFSYALEKIGNTVYSYLEGIDTDSGRIMVLRKQNGNQTTADYTTAFFVKDHLGSTRVMLNAQGDILERNAYYPFGLQMNQGKSYPTLTDRLPQLYSGYISPTPVRRDLYNGKEIQTTAETDYLDYGFRQYDPVTARWFNIDPKTEKYLPLTPYNYCASEPVNRIETNGSVFLDINNYSTHIDDEGRIITVINDGDFGVYQHGRNADGGKPTEYMIKKRAKKWGPSSGGTKVGETLYWDEFIDPETKTASTNYKIQLRKSFDPIISEKHSKAEKMSLDEIALNSLPEAEFDIKKDYPNEGRLLDGKYATSRSAGNFLAGYNARHGTMPGIIPGIHISHKTFQKQAGLLHIASKSRNKLTLAQLVLVCAYLYTHENASPLYQPPYWGENYYQHRMSLDGWNYNPQKSK